MATPSQVSLHPPPSPFKLSRPTTCRQDSRRSSGLGEFGRMQPVKAFAKQISFDPTVNLQSRFSMVEN